MAALPRVDVIIPVFNGLPYITDAVSSALRQQSVDARVIVVDDGSTDGTAEHLQALDIPMVRVITGHAHQSTSAARNRGVAASDAEWLCFLDADDLWPEARTHLLLESIREPHRQIAMGHVLPFTGDGWPEVSDSDPLDALPVAACAGGVVSSRIVFESVGLFDESLQVGEYVDWLARSRTLGIEELIVPTISLLRRRHSDNTSSRDKDSYALDMLRIVAKHRNRSRLSH